MLTLRQKKLIQSTIPKIKQQDIVFSDYFYQRMLSIHPELRQTYHTEQYHNGARAKALANTLLSYAENIDTPSVLISLVNVICHQHVSLNIPNEDYDLIGYHLLHFISELLDAPLASELIMAWAQAYQQLTELFMVTEKKYVNTFKKTKVCEGSDPHQPGNIIDKIQ